jgi:thiol-disulfide isomerase/thioredoxin
MYRLLLLAIIIVSYAGCTPSSSTLNHDFPAGMWRGTLAYQEEELPFNFNVVETASGDFELYIMNGKERLLLDEITFDGDSVTIPLHIFDASLRGRLSGDSLKGYFIKHYDPANTIPFTAVHGQSFRFRRAENKTSTKDFSGKFRVAFYTLTDTTHAVGVFLQRNDSVTGSFLTPTGDYRYLQGNVINDSLFLSAFDGNHAYLFIAAFENRDELNGTFYSGRTKKTLWKGWRDENATLPDPESQTYLKEGYDKIEFTFPDINGTQVSLTDEKYSNKVIILQIFGTWCPNCMDETRFLAPWYDKNKDRGVEIIGLAFERKDDFAYASERVKKMIEKLDVRYDFLIAGTNDKERASATLPALNRIVSFPTTIFIGKDGKVKKIHTGFTGPGTGEYYEQFIEHFNETVNTLLNEQSGT